MLNFVTINVDGEYKEWSFDSVEELREFYHEEDYSGPGNDDPVTEMEFFGIPMYVNCFDNIVELFGLEEETDNGTLPVTKYQNKFEKEWDKLHAKYPIDREEMTEEQHIAYVNECFDLYEKEGFAKKYWSPYGDYPEYIGMSFEVVGRCSENEDTDLEVLPLWRVRFEDGFEGQAYPEEIIPSQMQANGCHSIEKYI